MSFDSFDDANFDFKKIFQQLAKQLENMPPPFGPMFKDFMAKIENMDPEQLNEMLHNMMNSENSSINFNDILGEDFMKGGFNFFNMMNNPDMMNKFHDIINSANVNVKVSKVDNVEEPYYEFIDNEDSTGGELLIELPGIKDSRNIVWDIQEDSFNLSTNNDGQKYKLSINLTKPMNIKSAASTFKNQILILPYQY
jgi:HSP20 family molecular chaperone IbpA